MTQHTDAQDYELDYCLACNQMTNHVRKDECEKCLVTAQGEDELSKDFLTSLRWLGEGYYGNKLFGEHLRYQHALQGLIASEISKQREQARQEGYEEGRRVEKTMEPIYRRDERNALLDELEAKLPEFKEDDEHDVFVSKAVNVWDITTEFINAKRKKGKKE